MRQIRFLLFLLFFSFIGKAQTGIGTTTPHASAKLDVSSTNKGFLPPRITLTALNSASPVTSPATGLLIFNTATVGIIPNQVTPGYYYWDGVNSKWVRLEDKADNLGNHTATDNIRLNGYYLSNDGGAEGIRVDNSGNIGIGTNTPTSKLNIAGGGVKLATGFGNSTNRPSLNTSSIGNYEIRGVGGSPQIDGQDDGFLRLSAGGGTNVNTQSSIDITGYSTIADMNNNIVMRTGGTERLRIDNSGNVNMNGKLNIGDPTGNVSTKLVGRVTAGTFLTFDNLKFSVTTYEPRGLSIATVSGTVNLYVEGKYNNASNTIYGSRTDTAIPYTTSPSGTLFGWGFNSAGDTIVYHLTDPDNSRMYRVTLIIMPSYINNFIAIERLL